VGQESDYNGGPGSGKTMILLHRAKYLKDQLNIEKDKFHIFVYTNVLKNYIKSAMDLLNLPDDCVTNLDSWCITYYRRHINGRLPFDYENKTFDFRKIRKEVLNYLKNDKKQPQFDFIMVDEGQDLDVISYEILRIISKHITVCMDPKQKIFEQGSDKNTIFSILGVKRANINLLETYRCSPYIVNLASQFIDDENEKREYILQNNVKQINIETPVLYFAKDASDEKLNLITIVKTRQYKDSRLAVLFPKTKQVYGYANSFKEAGINVETMGDLDFNSNNPKFITYESAKGLTFETVIMPRLVEFSFKGIEEERLKKRIFVAITRATDWVYMSTVVGNEISLIKRLSEKGEAKDLTIRKYNDTTSDKKVNNENNENDDSDILDLF
jgi:superfamily I DNA/RNA helicase